MPEPEWNPRGRIALFILTLGCMTSEIQPHSRTVRPPEGIKQQRVRRALIARRDWRIPVGQVLHAKEQLERVVIHLAQTVARAEIEIHSSGDMIIVDAVGQVDAVAGLIGTDQSGVE